MQAEDGHEDRQHPFNLGVAQDTDVKIKKNQMLYLLCALIMGVIYCLILFLLNLELPGAVAACALVLFLVALIHLMVTKRSGFAAHISIITTLIATLAVHVCFGGGPGSVGLNLGAYLAPMLALLLGLGYKKAIGTFIFVFIGNLVLAVLELTVGPQYVTPKVYAFTGFWRAAFYWMNINVTQMITYIMVAVTYQQMQNGKRRLEESKREVDALSAELAEHSGTDRNMPTRSVFRDRRDCCLVCAR